MCSLTHRVEVSEAIAVLVEVTGISEHRLSPTEIVAQNLDGDGGRD